MAETLCAYLGEIYERSEFPIPISLCCLSSGRLAECQHIQKMFRYTNYKVTLNATLQ